MAEGKRTPLVVLAVLVVLAIGLYVTGAAGAAGGRPEAGWSNPLAGVSVGDRLRPEELARVEGDCSVAATITFVGGCRLAVAPVEGGWPWQRVTRSVRLVGGTGQVRLALTVQGKALRTDLDPGDDVRLTFTRDGGELTMACLAVGGCTVALAEDEPR